MKKNSVAIVTGASQGIGHLADHPCPNRRRYLSGIGIEKRALAFTYRIHGTGVSRISTPLQTLCVTATAFLPKLFEHQPSISQTLFQHYYLVV
jgi:hypothetical protein